MRFVGVTLLLEKFLISGSNSILLDSSMADDFFVVLIDILEVEFLLIEAPDRFDIIEFLLAEEPLDEAKLDIVDEAAELSSSRSS